jgi:protein-L-isoaspartate(D-aspartate) O-methyltransferase
MKVSHFNMVEQQLRTWGILNHRALAILSQVDREIFVPANFKNLAFADLSIVIGEEAKGEIMLAPKIIAKILQQLLELPAFADNAKAEKLLVVGTGSGYSTAVFSHIAKTTTSIEIREKLFTTARQNLIHSGIGNCELILGNALELNSCKFNYIILTASTPVVPKVFANLLHENGSILAFTGHSPAMQAQMITKLANDTWQTTTYFETVVPVLQGLPKAEEFKF